MTCIGFLRFSFAPFAYFALKSIVK
jgi:hypothetical protein